MGKTNSSAARRPREDALLLLRSGGERGLRAAQRAKFGRRPERRVVDRAARLSVLHKKTRSFTAG
jgi:hypothetical protein